MIPLERVSNRCTFQRVLIPGARTKARTKERAVSAGLGMGCIGFVQEESDASVPAVMSRNTTMEGFMEIFMVLCLIIVKEAALP